MWGGTGPEEAGRPGGHRGNDSTRRAAQSVGEGVKLAQSALTGAQKA